MINADNIMIFTFIGLMIVVFDFLYVVVLNSFINEDCDIIYLFLFLILLYLGGIFLASLISGPDFWAGGGIRFINFLFYLRMAIFAIQVVVHPYLYISKQIEGKKKLEQEKKRKFELTEQKEIEQKLFEKINKKSADILLFRVRKEAGALSPFLDENIAEVVETLRDKAHESYHNFLKRQVEYKDFKTAMEEIISDLVVIKEMVNPSISQVTYFDLLGVSVEAGAEEIKKAYRDIMKIIHPDVAKSRGANIDKANSLAEIINAAYAELL